MKSSIKQNRRATNVKLTEKERNTLIQARDIINKFYSKLNQDTDDEELPVLMCEEDAEAIGELGDLATDICTTYY